MSFLDNKKVGLALIFVGLINLLAGIGRVVSGIIDEDVDLVVAICYGIASLIFGALIFGYGIKVRGGPNDESDIVSGLIRRIGIVTILQAVFIAVAVALESDEGFGVALIGAIIGAIVTIIIGLIFIWAAGKVAGKSKNVISKFLWVILVVLFLIMAIITLFSAIVALLDVEIGLWNILGLVSAICICIVYLYCFVAMLSQDVKSSMGI